MGKFQKGILGGFSGKIGNVIGAFWKGIDYMRSLPRKSNKPATQLQLDVRYKFAMMLTFCKPLAAVIKRGFANAKNQTPMNAAVAYNLEHAVGGVSPDFTVDYPKVRFSYGPLDKPTGTIASALSVSTVGVSWNAKTGTLGEFKPTDQAMVLTYNPAQEVYVMLEGAADRADLQASITVPGDFAGERVHVWLLFVDTAGKRLSDSVYVGTVTVL